MKQPSSLSRQMLTYFGFIAIAALLITVEFVWAVRIIMSQTHSLMLNPAAKEGLAHLLEALRKLQDKALLIGIVQAVVTLIVLMMLIRRITDPLQQMIDKARRISEGDLSPTIQVQRRDEIGMLAETINGLTSNIQELVAFSLSSEASLQACLKVLRGRVLGDPVGCEQLEKIAKTLTGLGALLESFQLLPAPPSKTKDKASGK